MKPRFSLALLLPLAASIGCTLPSATPTPSNPAPTGAWANWQIQAGTAITSPPNSYPSFVGAIQIQGTQASGIFTPIAATGTSMAEDFSGSFTPASSVVLLATNGFGFDYTEPASPYTVVPVGVVGGCVYPPGYTGPECLAIFAVPSVGVQIAALNGTYIGTLTDTAQPNFSGAGTLTLTQSTTPNLSGQFPLTATLTFPSASGLGNYPLTGTVSGEGLALNFCSAAVIGPCIALTASTNPGATQIMVSNLTYNETTSGPTAAFSGTLILQ